MDPTTPAEEGVTRGADPSVPSGLPAVPSGPMALALCAAFIASGALLRLIPCFNNFWLDEIWSYFAARELKSPLEVLTTIHHSNNNHLYTLLMYLLGDRTHWAVYRIPSFLAGLGATALAAALAWRRDRLEAVWAALLTSFCFALINFSSEARGYSLAVFFALAAFGLLSRDLEAPRPRTALAFGLLVVLGFLSHLTYMFFYAGAVMWSVLEIRPREAGGRSRALHLLRLHLFPILCFLALYWIDLRKMQIGSGDHLPLPHLISLTLGYGLGFPALDALAIPYALLAAAVLVLALRPLWTERGPWSLYLITVVLAPVIVFTLAHPVVIAVRYFVIGIAFYLLLLARLLARLCREGVRRRALALAAGALFLIGNLAHTSAFLREGRGGYLKALRFMADHTQGSQIMTGFDNDFRSGIVARFYLRYLPPGKEIQYYSIGHWPAQGPEWVIVHRVERPPQRQTQMTDGAGNPYALVAEYDYAGASGFYWAVYHNLRVGERVPALPALGEPGGGASPAGDR